MPWNPDVKVTVTAMVISDKTIYVGGIPHGAATSVVAAYDLETGLSPTAWNGFVEGITIEGLLPWVWVLRVSGDTLFVGGENIGLSSGPSTTFIPLLALDARTGQIRSWSPWGSTPCSRTATWSPCTSRSRPRRGAWSAEIACEA